jgi:hypothetical protein
MAGKRKGKATVADKRAAFYAQRATGKSPKAQLAEMCDFVKAAADGKPDSRIKAAAEDVRRIAEGLNT